MLSNGFGNRSSTIILAFYSFKHDETFKLRWGSIRSYYSNLVVHWHSGPFVHVSLMLDDNLQSRQDSLHSVHLTKNTKTIINAEPSHFDRGGYSFLRIKITYRQKEIMRRTLQQIVANHAVFNFWAMIGTSRPSPKISVETTQWFCSQLIGYLLLEAKVIKNVDPYELSVTDLYLRVYDIAENLAYNPYVPSRKPLNAEQIYLKYTGHLPERIIDDGDLESESSTRACV